MNLNFQQTINGQSAYFQEFLFDDTRAEFLIQGTGTPVGFERAVGYIRDTAAWPDPEYGEDFFYFVNELYDVRIKGNSIGPAKVQVGRRQSVVIRPQFFLSFTADVPEEARNLIGEIFYSFNPRVHGADFEGWIADQMRQQALDENSVALSTELVLFKSGDFEVVRDEQRKWFLSMYGCEREGSKGNLDIVNLEYPVEKYFDEIEINVEECRPYGYELVLDPTPDLCNLCAQVDHGKTSDAATVSDAIDVIAKAFFPPECGVMIQHNERIMTLFEFPEFKLEWKMIEIRIGCVTITTKVPVIKIRWSKIVLFVYYYWPQSKGATLAGVARPCAISSAAKGTVAGIVAANPGVAAAEFAEEFAKCVALEFINCMKPGIALIKESDEWK